MWSQWSSSTPSTRPSHWANDKGTAFKNPWPSADRPSWSELAQISFPLSWYTDLTTKHPQTHDVKVVVPDWGKADLETRSLEKEKCIIGTTLGHAGAIAELPLLGTKGKESFWVVYDPIFSSRAGPTQYTGPQRLKEPPCQVTDLPGCDAVMISHNHYDHLDLATVSAIFKKFPKARYFVPLGNKDWLSSLGVPLKMVHELDWWDTIEYSVEDFGHTAVGSASEDTMLRITCTPAQHNSGRGALDQGTTLWCGWVVEQLLVSKDKADDSKTKRHGAIYHAGDTGYRRSAKSNAVCPVFKEIGEKFGGFDLSFIPIWRGGTLGFVSNLGLRLSHDDIPATLHVGPADALRIHKDVLSRNTIPVHFGTFIGSANESLESILEFEEERERQDVLHLDQEPVEGRSRAGITDIGGSIAVEILARDVI